MKAAKHRRLNGTMRPSYVQRLARRLSERAEAKRIQDDLASQYAAEDAATAPS